MFAEGCSPRSKQSLFEIGLGQVVRNMFFEQGD